MIFSITIRVVKQQSGAEEACWAHNPEVGGSKPLSATYIFLLDVFMHVVHLFVGCIHACGT